jgi:head-tail adaptor
VANSPTGAGPLDQLVALDRRGPADDGYGNTVSAWAEQFQANAAFVHVRGSETVMAARLEGRQTFIVRLRSSAAARSVTTDWRLRDVRLGNEFKIHEAVEDVTRAWVDLLVERPMAT